MAFDFGKFLEKMGLVARDPDPQPEEERDERSTRRDSDDRYGRRERAGRDGSDFGDGEQGQYERRSEERYRGYTRRTAQPAADSDNVVEFKTAQAQTPDHVSEDAQNRTVIRYLRSLDDCEAIISDMLDDMQIVLNIEDCDTATKQRAIDVIYGASFALKGKMRKASRDIFIIAPSNVLLNDNRDNDEQRRGGNGGGYNSNVRSFRS